ncbi:MULTISPECIES: hypothetical protein [unclassified Saccharopolyspora]|uniref:hypothetical protein n=1 Tax=unclassified Saccharopolyspora TaxID=2646250 RepID=UPI001CD33302|nr:MULTISPECIES: hypothetical protein [unclassified Saccharopolyspora]MCA1188975.1 hypothetical protein [Saccharopolyspora sp. 6T]MCA1194849.1 hypothetical protein [Saccharopolyspora sp. 6V]MCA1228128.1 hypothetical protein [Saccharopolyspora sp. 6M]MCA1282238.1 hypothetical protein [Saccharopolyspora sp. 7B]
MPHNQPDKGPSGGQPTCNAEIGVVRRQVVALVRVTIKADAGNRWCSSAASSKADASPERAKRTSAHGLHRAEAAERSHIEKSEFDERYRCQLTDRVPAARSVQRRDRRVKE